MGLRFFARLVPRFLAGDRFGMASAALAVALGVATVDTVLVLDVSTRRVEGKSWTSNPDLSPAMAETVGLRGLSPDGRPIAGEDAKEETHEDYQVMRTAIRLGSMSAFLVGAVIVFFAFAVTMERRTRELALLESLGATRRQIAGLVVAEASAVGLVGAAFGLVGSVPLSVILAWSGVSTTGRSRVRWLEFPWPDLLTISLLGAVVALLGVVGPIRRHLKKPSRDALAMTVTTSRGPSSPILVLLVPVVGLSYVLLRPILGELLPRLFFHGFDAVAAGLGFAAMLYAFPLVIERPGAFISGILFRKPRADERLVRLRIERGGRELWASVAEVMLVFGLLLALHLATLALKRETERWGEVAAEGFGYVYPRPGYAIPAGAADELLAQGATVARLSGRTPWPNTAYTADPRELAALAERRGDPAGAEVARRLGPGRAIVSTMMARRLHVREGDLIEVEGPDGPRRIEIASVSDRVGFAPTYGPYRNGKTYLILDHHDHGLIAHRAGPPGTALVFAADDLEGAVSALVGRFGRSYGYRMESGRTLIRDRATETDRDFLIFDLILVMATALAGLGTANHVVLSAHARRRELGILATLGMTGRDLSRMFLLESGFVGLFGGLLAVPLGGLLGHAAIEALRVVSAFEVHFELPPLYAALTVLGAVWLGIVAGVVPASRAARIGGPESLHFE